MDRIIGIKRAKLRWALSYFKRTIIYLCIWLTMVIVTALTMHNIVLNLLIGNADTALDFVSGYRDWYLCVIIVAIAMIIIQLVALMVMVVVRTLAFNKPEGEPRRKLFFVTFNPAIIVYLFFMFLISLGEIVVVVITDLWVNRKKPGKGSAGRMQRILSIFDADMFIKNMFMVLSIIFFFVIAHEERVVEVYREYKQDVVAIEEGNLESETIFLNIEYYESPMEVLGKGYPNTVFCFHGIGVENKDVGMSKWQEFYIPKYLEFEFDTKGAYNEIMSFQWNQENAKRYKVQFTPNQHVIVSIEPVRE